MIMNQRIAAWVLAGLTCLWFSSTARGDEPKSAQAAIQRGLTFLEEDAAKWRKETGRLIHRVPGPDSAHRQGQPIPRRFGEVGGGGGHQTQPELGRDVGPRGRAVGRVVGAGVRPPVARPST